MQFDPWFDEKNALFASIAKINGFWRKKFNRSVPDRGASRVMKKFQNTLIFSLEVIVQPHIWNYNFFQF